MVLLAFIVHSLAPAGSSPPAHACSSRNRGSVAKAAPGSRLHEKPECLPPSHQQQPPRRHQQCPAQVWFSACFTREGNKSKKEREQHVLSLVEKDYAFQARCRRELACLERERQQRHPGVGHTYIHTKQQRHPGVGHRGARDSSSTGALERFMEGLDDLDSMYGLPEGSLGLAHWDWPIHPGGGAGCGGSGVPANIFRVPKGEWFSQPKNVMWRKVGRCGYTVICDEADNTLAAMHFLTVIEQVFAEHFADPAGERDLSDCPEVLLERPEEVEALLRQFLPGGQLLLTTSMLARQFTREAASSLAPEVSCM
jgi:hypothetical protein